MNQDLINKIGNTALYLSGGFEKLELTKFLKLLYILEEESIKKNGIPFFNMDFKLWQYGPVHENTYLELKKENSSLFNDYFKLERKENNGKFSIKNNSKIIKINENVSFCDDEFSDNDLILLDAVIDRFKYCSTDEIVNHTHKDGSIWQIIAKINNLLTPENKLTMKTTDISLDLSILVKDDSFKVWRLNEYKQIHGIN